MVGAGPCGLTALKALKVQGIEADCFEKSDRVGGLWAMSSALGKSSAYRSLHINTSRERTQFADFPMPAHFPDYPHHSQICDYLNAYAEHFGLLDHVCFNTEVIRVTRDGTGYIVSLSDGRQQRYTAVLVANGHHSDPHWPKPPLPGYFDGSQIHSSQYLDPEEPLALRGQRVLVVGMGNSAMDIACELAYAGAHVTLSARRGAHVIPKWILGKPVDQTSFLPKWLPRPLRQRISQSLLELLAGRLEHHGLPRPDHRLGQAHPTLSSELLSLIRTGRITPKPAISRLCGREVLFADQTSRAVDAIVFCTGYNVSFPFLAESLVSAHGNDVPLYFRVHRPGVDGLFFIGLCQPVGAILPIAEAQASWVAEQLAGNYLLPDPSEMQRHMQAERDAMQQRYVASRRHTMQLDFEAYLKELARERARGRRRAERRSLRSSEARTARPALAARSRPD